MTGLMIGAICFGQISDIYGRKLTLLIAMTFNNIFILASSFAPNLFWFTVARFCVNIFNAGVISVLPIFALEILPQKHRYWIYNLVGGAPLVMICAAVAYFSNDWKTYARIISLLGVPGLLALCFVSESPRFLIQKGRMEEAKIVIKRMYRIDNRKFEDDVIDLVLDKENQAFIKKQTKNNNYTFLHLFYTPSLSRYAISIGLSFFTTSMMTYALMFNLEHIAGSIYLNLVLSGIVRYVAGGFISLLELKCPKVGRKTIHFGVLLIAASCLLTFFVVNLTGTQAHLALLLRIMALVILGFIAQIFLVAETKNNPLGDHMPEPEESWPCFRKDKNRSNHKDEKTEKLINKGDYIEV
uniref:Major facilitator superfamily (MFS) profile domain-containing protein n=1 Tax=Acrobeloides nanus TaxID=290746 RepID=A0A914EM50_9BILA